MLKRIMMALTPALIVGLLLTPRLTTAQGCNTLYTLARASVSSTGAQADGESSDPSLSGDGRYVAYSSQAVNLVANDDNLSDDIFVYDRQNCQTQRVSVRTDGTQANGASFAPSFSSDGRRLVFDSSASNLVASDNLGFTDVFQRNVPNSQTERASIAHDEEQANSDSFNDSTTTTTSADGRYIAFTSLATNLTTVNDTGTLRDVFVRDRFAATTELISVSTTGTQADGVSYWASISEDGRYVAFQSDASNLIPNGISFQFNIFIRDRQTATTTRINGISGAAPDALSTNPAISGDGRYVAFSSEATNYVSGDVAGVDLFLHDRQLGTTVRVTNGAGGGGFLNQSPALSRDGRFVVFSSDANNLVPNDTNDTSDVFVYNRLTAELSRVSVAANGTQADAGSQRGTISPDGTTISYKSYATNLVANDTNTDADIFVAPRYVASGGNLLTNGDFDAGFAAWGAFSSPSASDITYNVVGGVLEFTRAVQPSGVSNSAVVLQESGYPVPTQGGLDASVEIGNGSAVRKRVTILLHDSDFSDLQVCTFWLSPNAPLRAYRMTARTTEAWTNATISIYASTADGVGAYRIDNASLKIVPPPTSSRTMCYDPDAPPANPQDDSAEWLTNGNFEAGFAGWLQFFAIQTQVVGGVLEFYGDGSPTGVAFQETANAVPTGSVIEARFDVGSSAPRRRITILLRDADFSDLQVCTFWLPANASLGSYAMRAFTTEAWMGASLSFYPSTQGSNGWYRVDNVSFRARPSKSIVGTECYPPGTSPAEVDAPFVDPLDLFTPLNVTATPTGGEGALTEGAFPALPGLAPEMPLIATSTPPPPVNVGEGTTTE